MPKWIAVEETGILMREGKSYVLALAEGGHWRLEDLPRSKTELLGGRVTVKGMRVGFNNISVDTIARA